MAVLTEYSGRCCTYHTETPDAVVLITQRDIILSADVIHGSNQVKCLQIVFMPHIGGNIIAFDDFKNAFQFIDFDTVMKIITESLKIFFFIYDFIRSIAKKTGQFCYCEIGIG